MSARSKRRARQDRPGLTVDEKRRVGGRERTLQRGPSVNADRDRTHPPGTTLFSTGMTCPQTDIYGNDCCGGFLWIIPRHCRFPACSGCGQSAHWALVPDEELSTQGMANNEEVA
jgi:hypothetical protein